jgi:hypothetical protein
MSVSAILLCKLNYRAQIITYRQRYHDAAAI